MSWKNIIFKKENKIGFITLNRPEVYNALNAVLLSELEEVVEEIKKDSDIGIIILTGAGEKAFVSGADIAEIPASNAMLAWASSRDHQGTSTNWSGWENLPLLPSTGTASGEGWS